MGTLMAGAWTNTVDRMLMVDVDETLQYGLIEFNDMVCSQIWYEISCQT